MISKPNFNKAEQTAINLLREGKFTELPIKVKEIANIFNNLKIRPYTWFAKKRGLSLEEVCLFAESEEGCCYYQKKNHKYLILYNDNIANPGRRRWTIAHEIGHYVLKHNELTNKTILSRSSLSNDEYKTFEKEADCFARSLLAPSSILFALRKFNAQDISKWFDLSMLAAVNVLKFFNKGVSLGRRHNPNDPLVKKFENYIFNINNARRCHRCKHNFISAVSNYCPVCGSKKITNKRVETNMKYDGYELDEYGRAIKCPRCQNEEITGGNYCKICGVDVINRCNNIGMDWNGNPVAICNEIAEGNARYCISCGHKTTFFENGLLIPWDEEYKHGKKQEHKSYLEHLDEEAEHEAEMEHEQEKERHDYLMMMAMEKTLEFE